MECRAFAQRLSAGCRTALLAAFATAFSHAASSAGNDDWADYYGTSNGWRYSALKQIDKSNVRKLKVAWIHQAAGWGGWFGMIGGEAFPEILKINGAASLSKRR